MDNIKTDETVLPVVLPNPNPTTPLEAFSWLGDTETEILAGLRERGIKGTVCNPSLCLFAQYLNLWWEDVLVGTEDCEVGDRHATYDLPFVIEEIARKFDLGFYPDLIDSDGPE